MDENEWNYNLSKLKNDFSQILYLIYYLYSKNQINKEQKILLKNLVLLNKTSIFELLKNLKETQNINEFSLSIKKLITETSINNAKIEDTFYKKSKSKHLITISSWNEETNNEDNYIDDIKSPVNCIKTMLGKQLK